MPTSVGYWYLAFLLIAWGLFLSSTLIGSVTWDEPIDFDIVTQQLLFVRDTLFGSSSRTFSSFTLDYAFYGIGTLLPAYVFSYLIDVVLNGAKETLGRSFSPPLHFLAFACAIAGVSYTRRLVCLVTGERETSLLAGIALLVTPFWVGYGFFDYKDMPVAAGLVAATYYAAAYMRDGRARTSSFFFLALLFLGTQKLAAVPLALPACAAVLFATVRQRSPRKIAIFAGQIILFLALLYLVTPPAWREVLSFVTANIEYMSAHRWRGCTLTAGQCIGRNFNNGEGYSAVKYLAFWYAAQLPIALLLGLLASIYLYVRSFRSVPSCQHLIMAALVWPIAAIALLNSTLLDGIRHTLFLQPLAVVLVFVTVPPTWWSRWRSWLLCYFVFLLADTVSLHPYGYIWFNEAARFFASDKNYETDYWAYSIREAAVRAKGLQGPTDWVVSDKLELVKPILSERSAEDVHSVPFGNAYFFVNLTKGNAQPPQECEKVDYLTRRQLLAPSPLRLAFVATCRR
jgi:hypothetical protein